MYAYRICVCVYVMVLEVVLIYTVQNRVASNLKKACYHYFLFCLSSLCYLLVEKKIRWIFLWDVQSLEFINCLLCHLICSLVRTRCFIKFSFNYFLWDCFMNGFPKCINLLGIEKWWHFNFTILSFIRWMFSIKRNFSSTVWLLWLSILTRLNSFSCLPVFKIRSWFVHTLQG